jgi:hypothetical protein
MGRVTVPSDAVLVANCLRIAELASPAQRSEALVWYPRMHELTISVCEDSMVQAAAPSHIGAMISAASPVGVWEKQAEICLFQARWIRAGGSERGIPGVNLTGANRRMMALTFWCGPSVLTGLKRINFSGASQLQRDCGAIDAMVFRGMVGSYSLYRDSHPYNDAEYMRMLRCLRTAAAMLGMKCYELQALIWLYVRALSQSFTLDQTTLPVASVVPTEYILG